MRKSHYRDYATEAFRALALVGSSNKYYQCLWNQFVQEHGDEIHSSGDVSKPTESAVMYAQERMRELSSVFEDIEAAERTLHIISQMSEGRARVEAVQMVYMSNPSQGIERGEISERTHRASLRIPASERAIYNWLSAARRIFAEERGLRTKEITEIIKSIESVQ